MYMYNMLYKLLKWCTLCLMHIYMYSHADIHSYLWHFGRSLVGKLPTKWIELGCKGQMFLVIARQVALSGLGESVYEG